MDRPQPQMQSHQQRRRRRPALSCYECRRRKIKCDRNEPCAHCVRQSTQCVYTLYGDSNEPIPRAGAAVVMPPGRLPEGQLELPAPGSRSHARAGPQASLASPAASMPSCDSRGSVSNASPLGITTPVGNYALTRNDIRARDQPEQLPQSAASFVHSVTENRGGHQRPYQTSNSGEAPASNANGACHGHSQPVPVPCVCSGSSQPPSSPPLLHRNNSNTGKHVNASADSRIAALLQRIERLEGFNHTVSRNTDSDERLAASLRASSDPEASWSESFARYDHDRFEEGPREWQVVLDKSRDLGRSRWSGGAPDFAAIIACYSAMLGKGDKGFPTHEPEIAALVGQAREFLLKCKSIARRLKVGRPSTYLPIPSTAPEFGLRLVPPSREVADAMAKLYFASFESAYRILHIPTFWNDYERYWDSPETATDSLRLKVLLVVAIGSSLHNHEDSRAALHTLDMVRPWVYAAEAWLTGPLEKDRLDIGGLQIYCLSVIARQIFSIGGDLIWISMGSLVHRAMQIGLHREPKHFPSISVLYAELRRRLWATILDMVVQASLDARMPPRISLDEFDIEPPSNIDDDDIDESSTVIVPRPRTIFTATSVQLALLDSFPVRLRIVQYLNGLHSEPSYSRVLSLSSELTNALRSSSNLGVTRASEQPSDRETDQDPVEGSPMSPLQRSFLDFLIRRFMIPLHYAFANQARSNPLFHSSLKLSIDAALALVTPETETGTESGGGNNASGGGNSRFGRLLATGGGLFREGLRCTITAISLELLSQVDAQRLDGTLHRVTLHRDLLKRAARDLLDLSERRIRYGETNVKAHMFLSMVLAQVEAVEASGGSSGVEVAIARAAMESLRSCHEILNKRVDTVSLGSLEASEQGAFGPGAGDEMDGMTTCGDMGLDAYGMDWDWEVLLPSVNSF